MESKICSGCGIEKPIEEYHKNKAASHGLVSRCIPCQKEYTKLYKRTYKGLCTSIYIEQKNSSKVRGHPLPNYSSKDLYVWITNQPNFLSLFDSWILDKYSRRSRPSVDRIDNSKPYTLCNIRLVTFKYNNERSHVDAANGEFQELKPVDCFDLNSNFICSYKSISEASRQSGVAAGAIHSSCNSKGKAAKKYLWRYTGDMHIPKYKSICRTYVQYSKEGEILFKSNSIQGILTYLSKVNISPLNKSIRKGTTYLGFKWGIENE